jgi:hypothetical protein
LDNATTTQKVTAGAESQAEALLGQHAEALFEKTAGSVSTSEVKFDGSSYTSAAAAKVKVEAKDEVAINAAEATVKNVEFNIVRAKAMQLASDMTSTRHLCDSQVAAQAGAQDVAAQASAQDVAAQEDAQTAAQAAIVAEGTTLQPTSDISAQTALGALAGVLHVERVSPRVSVRVADAQALATQAVAVQSTVVGQAAAQEAAQDAAQDVAAQVDVAYVDVDVAQAAATTTDHWDAA